MKILIYTSLLTITFNLSAQSSKEIEILNADNTYANINKHPEFWRLIDNVCFKHNNAIMTCDSAYHYINKDKITAFGKIKIKQGDTIKLTGNNLTYYGAKNIADVNGNVVLIDKYMILETDQILYNLKSNIAYYPKSGTIIDNEKIINSKRGEYNSKNQKFIFTDSVSVTSKNYKIFTENMHYNSNSKTSYFFGPSLIQSKNKKIYCENGWYNTKTDISQFQKNASIKTENYILKGDSLYYNGKIGFGKAIKNIELVDTLENIIIYGNLAKYFEKDKIVEITLEPELQVLFEEDTLFMHAKKFISQNNNDEKQIIAYDNVKFFKKDLQGKSDSLSYSVKDSILEMFKKPILWSNKFQVTADSLKFLVNNEKISRIFLKPNPMIISQEDSLDFNQIKGKRMIAFLNDNKINKINVKGNGQSIFFIIDEKNNSKVGLNYTECTDLILYFKNNKLDLVTYELEPNSIITPYKDLKYEDRFLDGFFWRGSERPIIKNDIFTE